jgi:cell division protein FtsQ
MGTSPVKRWAAATLDAMIGEGDSLATLAQGVRSGNLFSNRGSAVLDAPERSRVPSGFKRGAPVTEMPLRRDAAYDAGDFAGDAESVLGGRAQRGLRVSFQGGLIPKTLWGRIAAGCGLLVVLGCAIAAALGVRSFLLHDEHFIVADARSIDIAGASHLTRAQLLSVFGEDVDRNIFLIPLAGRQAELERMPWVEHATVMRLLPNRVRVAIVERTPVAFVRQGNQIGLVDANGALFDLPGPEMEQASGGKAPHYSFPVLTGISSADPLSTRAARMRIYMGFMTALDAAGENVSRKLSEVDVSNPEDEKAVISDAGGADVLVHFGDERFLERYHAYRDHLAEWRAQYPRLASADMRYERQVVLGMRQDAPPAASAGEGKVDAAAKNTASMSSTSSSMIKPAASKIAVAIPAKAKSPTHAKATAKKNVGSAKRMTAAHTASKTTAQAPTSRVAPGGMAR